LWIVISSHLGPYQCCEMMQLLHIGGATPCAHAFR